MCRNVLGAVLLALILSGRPQVAGQESADDTATPSELPPGVALTRLASQEMGPLPEAPAWVGLARFTFAAGAQGSAEVAPGPTLFIVETGSITFELGDGQATVGATPAGGNSVLGPGERFFIAANGSYTARNGGGSEATALRVVIYPAAPLIQPAAGVSYQLLTGGIVEALSSERTVVAVSRVSLAAGADVSTRAGGADGPILVFVESGLVSLELPGAQAVLSPGGTALIQSNNESTAHNADGRPALVLVLAISTADPDDAVGTPVP